MLAVLGLIPILLLIHTLKPKPRQVDVSNLFLWQEVLRERSSQLTFERLKKEFAAFISDSHCTHCRFGTGETDLEV